MAAPKYEKTNLVPKEEKAKPLKVLRNPHNNSSQGEKYTMLPMDVEPAPNFLQARMVAQVATTRREYTYPYIDDTLDPGSRTIPWKMTSDRRTTTRPTTGPYDMNIVGIYNNETV